MKNRNKIYLAASMIACFILAACTSFNDARDAKKITYISATIQSTSLLDEVQDLGGLRLVLINEREGWRSAHTLTGNSMNVEKISPGFYTIQISGEKTGTDGIAYTMNGSTRAEIIFGEEVVGINVGGLQYSPLIFKEIFYNNVRYTNSSGVLTQYIFSQFYEIYNNSEEIAYMDGLYICNVSPTSASDSSNKGFASVFKPDVRKVDGVDVNIYAERIWKFPGSGTDYPLEPGESCIVTMRAMNHTTVGPELLDMRTTEFEFWMKQSGAAYDFDAPNMIHCYYDNSIESGTLVQYLVAVVGPAMALFKAPDNYNPLANQTQFIHPTNANSNCYYSIIPLSWVLDAVECGQSPEYIGYKRISPVLDAGMMTVGAGNNGFTIMRKVLRDENGEPVLGPNGDYRYQDINNSSEDFDSTTSLTIRRYGAKMPSWNHSLQ